MRVRNNWGIEATFKKSKYKLLEYKPFPVEEEKEFVYVDINTDFSDY